LDELFADLKSKYDYIIVDTAPIGIVSDTYLLNRMADNFVFVTRQKYTPKDATQLINEVYAEKRLNGMGVVLNGTPASSGYGYGYGHGYGYGYGHKKVDYKPKLSFGERLNNFFERINRRLSKR
jgi:Mrp family chromosome partitioning ATPase